MSEHSELSPSSAHRWMRCPGSVALSRGVPGTSSDAADEGTLAHTIAADSLTSKHKVKDHPLIGDLGDDNISPLQSYVDYVAEKMASASLLMVEQRYPLQPWLGPDSWGTADAVIFNPWSGLLRVIDLKFGRGNVVYANEREGDELRINPQLALYALGAIEYYEWLGDITEVEMVIHQPRREHISVVASTVCDLRAYGLEIANHAVMALTSRAPIVPGEKQCQWCPVKATCAARATWLIASFENEVALMNELQVAENLGKVKAMRDWCNDLEAYATARLRDRATSIPGWKLVQGRAQRRWNADAESTLFECLGYQAYAERELIGIGAAEKMLGSRAKEVMPAITIKTGGSEVLAPASDPRPPVSSPIDDVDEVKP